MANYISKNQMQSMKDYHIRHRIPYRMYQCNESVTIISQEGTFTNRESKFPSNELWFIGAIKKHIIENKLYLKVKNNFKRKNSGRKIKYFYFNKRYKPGTILRDCYEIDLKSAYFETAYKMGLIPDHLYDRATKKVGDKEPISKRSRLAAIGSLDRKRTVVDFDGKKQVIGPIERQKKTGFLWNTICHRVGRLMYRISRKCPDNDFIFFWVDAMFVKKRSAKKVQRLMKKAGYNCSVIKIKKITFTNESILVDGKVKLIEDKKTGKWIKKTQRPFPYKQALTDRQIHDLAG